MKNNIEKKEVGIIAVYKYLVNSFTFIAGLMLIIAKGNLVEFAKNFDSKFLIQKAMRIMSNYFERTGHEINNAVILFAVVMLSFAILELFFTSYMIKKRRWGAIALVVITFVWLMFEFIFVIKVFTITKIGFVLVNIIIIIALIRILRHKKVFR